MREFSAGAPVQLRDTAHQRRLTNITTEMDGPQDMCIRVGRKTPFWKLQGTTIGKLASYIQMNVCKILTRSVKPIHERIKDE